MLAGEGASVTGSVTVTDVAGNSAMFTSPALKVDRTAPVVAVTGVTEGATYTRGSVPIAGCATTDPLSGVATNATASVTGGTVNGVGSFTATCSGATDKVGNASPPVRVTYTVQYRFTGFFEPVDNPPIVNTVTAGQSVALKWNLDGVSTLSSMVSVQWQVVACGSLTGVESPAESTTTGGTTFRYDATGGQFIYNLETDRKWAGSCRKVVLTLDDGTTRTADFRFR